MSAFNPNWASVPGNTILDILQERKISNEDFIHKMDQPADYIHGLLYGNIIISDETAQKLSQVLGASKQFWLNRQHQYQDTLLTLNKLTNEQWIKDIPFKEMVKLGWISDNSYRLKTCLDFFGIDNVSEWAAIYNSKIGESISFRTSTAFNSKTGPLTCWLRKGEMVGENTVCKDWNEESFRDSLHQIKKLTREKRPDRFLPKLKSICADNGVAVAIVKAPSGCMASGATTFLSPKKAVVILSFRHLSDDHFWFTFFHEAGHLLLHKSKSFFVEGLSNNEDFEIDNNRENCEAEANDFAANWLVNNQLHSRMSKLKGNKRDIISFASEAGVSTGIVIGQMQHYKYISRNYLNNFKRRYKWEDIYPLLD